MATGSSVAGGVEFDLPDEVLAVIPTDPYDQLDLARRITAMAITARITCLEADAAALRTDLAARDAAADGLRARAARLAARVADSEARLRTALDENARLAKERDALALEAKKLSKNLAKLEMFKKQLKDSLSDDSVNQQSQITYEDDNGDFVARIPSTSEEVSSSRSVSSAHRSMISDSVQDGYQLSLTPYAASTPQKTSSTASPQGFSTPVMSSGQTSPTRSCYDGRSAFSAWYPSSQQSSSISSPREQRSFSGRPRIDGKEFFRQARTRLSYEQFGAFLANIKEFNAQKQSREETLLKAEETFGPENKDLFLSFQNMLNRNKS